MLHNHLNISGLDYSLSTFKLLDVNTETVGLPITSEILIEVSNNLALLSMSYAYFTSFSREQMVFDLVSPSSDGAYLLSQIDSTTDFNVRIDELHSHTLHWSAWFYDHEHNPLCDSTCLQEGMKAIVSLYCKALGDIKLHLAAFDNLRSNQSYSMLKAFDANAASEELTLTSVDCELAEISNKVISSIAKLLA